jgi:hypothetical protein
LSPGSLRYPSMTVVSGRPIGSCSLQSVDMRVCVRKLPKMWDTRPLNRVA